MKKKILSCLFLTLISCLMIINASYAADVTEKFYQDITINNDGSITIKEAAVLSGDYNGRSREIRYKNSNSVKFTGIYSNFAGNTDIYDGTDITNIKIYDISQSNFDTIDDINKIENEYKKVDNASNGKYGVYTMSTYSTGLDFKIFCPARKKKVFCMEYTIKDAVAVHNDVAELYWNLIGNAYREEIEDFQVIVHLPGEDNDVRVWTHGPLSGVNKILDNKTVSFSDKDVKARQQETIRIMFNKDLVPNANKRSNVDGRENILKYEEMMANNANATRENQKLEEINSASQTVMTLEESPTMYMYNYALKKVKRLSNSEEKEEFLARIEKVKDAVNENWRENIENELEYYSMPGASLKRYWIERLKENVEEGFDEEAKAKYLQEVAKLEEVLDTKEAKRRTRSKIIVAIPYALLAIAMVYEVIKITNERNLCKDLYYRDFPGDYNPYVLEYLMKRKITNLSISTTILNLINKNVIKLEENPEDKKDAILRFKDTEANLTDAEKDITTMLFSLVGNNNRCTLKQLKRYGTTESRARSLQRKINAFKKNAKVEAEVEGFFEKDTKNILLKIAILFNYVFSLFMAMGIFIGNTTDSILQYFLGTTIISFVFFKVTNAYKNRSKAGAEEYSKWLAHKRFLKDFGKFDEKDLPDITLWDKYLVTATVLGCADKVQKKMKLYINNNSDFDTTRASYYLLSSSINNNMVRSIEKAVNGSIGTARSTISASSSGSSSSGGGFGGGSSSGGGGGRTEEAAEVVSRIKILILQ